MTKGRLEDNDIFKRLNQRFNSAHRNFTGGNAFLLMPYSIQALEAPWIFIFFLCTRSLGTLFYLKKKSLKALPRDSALCFCPLLCVSLILGLLFFPSKTIILFCPYFPSLLGRDCVHLSSFLHADTPFPPYQVPLFQPSPGQEFFVQLLSSPSPFPRVLQIFPMAQAPHAPLSSFLQQVCISYLQFSPVLPFVALSILWNNGIYQTQLSRVNRFKPCR